MSGETTIVNVHTKKPYDIYIGRAAKGQSKNKYANPFPIDVEKGETREIVIAKHKVHLWGQIKSGEISLDDLILMDGKVLGCWCDWPRQKCHGDNFIAAIKWAKTKKGLL